MAIEAYALKYNDSHSSDARAPTQLSDVLDLRIFTFFVSKHHQRTQLVAFNRLHNSQAILRTQHKTIIICLKSPDRCARASAQCLSLSVFLYLHSVKLPSRRCCRSTIAVAGATHPHNAALECCEWIGRVHGERHQLLGRQWMPRAERTGRIQVFVVVVTAAIQSRGRHVFDQIDVVA